MQQAIESPPGVLLVGGPSGSGKTTLASAWAARQPQATHIEFDRLVGAINWLAEDIPKQRICIEAACAAVRALVEEGSAAVVDDVLDPYDYSASWEPLLQGIGVRVVILTPTSDAIRRRMENHLRISSAVLQSQIDAAFEWPEQFRLDNSDLSVEETLAVLNGLNGC